ncbi:MAG: hypothetical protein ISS72_08050 [Candidatus Brocadiae bacterium]|nr:hypothetical protein [Candidatus Brocadiia bacterium]
MTTGATIGVLTTVLVLSTVLLFELLRGDRLAGQWARSDVVLCASGLPAILIVEWLAARPVASGPVGLGVATIMAALIWAPLVALGAEGTMELFMSRRQGDA